MRQELSLLNGGANVTVVENVERIGYKYVPDTFIRKVLFTAR
jgi:hypothetical protein